jgi:16S rRNA (adenine1518-N6/adenine1519-N6)-dimethyltransferase
MITLMNTKNNAPLKKYGQNFLTSPATAQRIVDSAGLMADDVVLEIGPGKGVLTKLMSDRCRKIWAVEIDVRWAEKLLTESIENPKIRIINQDILQYDLSEFFKDASGQYKIVANLPYNITVPILEKLLKTSSQPIAIVVMIQREMADRMAAKPGNKDYGSLSVFIQYHATVEKLFNVPPGSFFPRPKVTSSVIRLVPHRKPPFALDDDKDFFEFVKACFSQRRKMLRSVLKQQDRWPEGAFLKIKDIDLSRRAETMDMYEFLKIYENLQEAAEC